MTGFLDTVKRWFRGTEHEVREAAEGGVAVATPLGDEDREISTNAQTAGAADEPYPGND